MKSASSLLVSVALAAVAVAQDSTIRIETPIGPVVCQPVLLTWTGGTPPYFLNILPGGQPSAQPIEQFTNLQGTTFTWNVNQAPGTSLGLTLRDSTGATGQSAPFTVNSGPDTSCLNSTSSSSAGASSSASSSSASVSSAASSTAPGSSVTSASTPATSATTPATTPATSATPASSASRATSSSASTSPAPSATGGSQNNGAENLAISGLTGLVAAFVAAIIA